MPTVIIPPTDVSPNTGSGSEVLATDPVFPNNITVNGTTDSSSKDTGAIVTEGGLGVEKSASIGGNLTVSGTGTTGGNLRVRNALGYATGIHTGTTSDSTQQLLLSSNAAYNHAYISKGSTTLGIGFSSDNGSFVADDSITITAATKLVTLTGNLTVSGTGTSSVAGNLNIGEPAGSGYRLYVKAGFGLALGGSYIECGEYDKPCSILNHTNPAVSANLFQIQKQGTGVFTVSSAGNLGIGTTSPLGVLDVRSTTPDVLFNGKDTADPVLYFGRYQYDNVSKSGAAIKYVHGSAGGSQEYGRLTFLTATGSFGALTERMRINESGNLLIGTNIDAGGKLQIATGASNTLLIGNDATYTSYNQISLNGTRTNSGVLGIIGGGTGDSQLYLLAPTGGGLLFQIAGSTVFSVNSSGNATFAGTSVTVDGASTGSTLTLKRASNANGAIISYKTTTTSKWYHGLRGLVDDNWYLQNDVAGNTALFFDASTSNATFAGTVKIANTAEIKGVYTTTTTFDFGTIANNDASSVCTLTMTGVSSSDSIIVSPTDGDNFPQFCTVSAVPSGNTVAIRLYNGSGSSRTVGSRSIRVTAIKF